MIGPRRRYAAALTVALASFLLGAAATAQTPATTRTALLRGLGVDEPLTAPAVLAPAMDRARITAADFPLFVRVIVDWSDISASLTSGRWNALDARLAVYESKKIPVLLDLHDTAVSVDRSAEWPGQIRALAAHVRGKVAGVQIDVETPRPDPKTYAFFVRIAAVQWRSVDPSIFVAMTDVGLADADWLRACYAEDLATAVDVTPISTASPATPDAGDWLAPLLALVDKSDPSAVVLSTARPSR